MARMKRYEMAIRNVVGKDLEKYTKEEYFLIDYAHDADRAEESLMEASGRMVELFQQDIERVGVGYPGNNPFGYSCADDAVRHKIELEERAKALRYMVRLVLGSEVEDKFLAALELVRKTQLETLNAQKEAAKRGPDFSARRM